jgi:arylformamidase
MPLLDLSHSVEDGMVTYRGLPAPVVCDFLSREAWREVYAPGTEFHIGFGTFPVRAFAET